MRNLPVRVVFAVCLALFATFAARSAEAPQNPVEAVWRPQRLVFQYRSEGTMYSCDILEQKVMMILRRLGAHDRLEIRPVACQDFAGSVQLEVLMQSPVVATADNIRDITNYDSKDELIARVRGVALHSGEDLERFPAVWDKVSIRSAGKLGLQDRDCALVQQLRRQLLPKMSVQVIKDINRLDCSQESPRLTVMALVATQGKRVERGF